MADLGTERRQPWLRAITDPASTLPVYLGVVVAAVGFVLLVIGWSDVAGTVDVGRQMPYLMSTGLPGIALVMVGLVVVNISIRRQDSAERARQMSALTETLDKLRASDSK
ncbi:MAG TPA: hypothetical protein VHW74_15610 [Mycobacteriales bacterium]|jgi:uncharacterized membrane protein|nr:hypothetical protein [Mycobacteriales bacterium]